MTLLRSAAPPVTGGRSEVVREANALLESTRFHRGDSRWLSGRRVELLISPVPAAAGETAILVTLASIEARRQDLAGLVVQAVDADGCQHQVSLDEHGNALLSLQTDSYRLSVDAPAVAVTGGRSLGAGAGRGRGGRAAGPAGAPGPSGDPEPTPGRRRPRLPIGLAVAAAVMVALLLSATLMVVQPPPAGAVTLTSETERCPSPGAGGDERHVEIVATWGDEEKKRFKQVLTPFAEEAGIRVTVASREEDPEAPDRNLSATLASRSARGCLPGVALLPQTGLLRHLVSNGSVLPIENVAGPLVDKHYNAAWRRLGTVDDVLYGVWFKASDKSLIWYNTAAFEKARIEALPKTWDELTETAGRLHAAGVTPFSIAGADDSAWTLTDWFENVYLRTAGGGSYESLARGQLSWTDQSVVTALETLSEVFGRTEWIAGGPEEARRTSYEESVKKVFGTPKDPAAAMVFEGDFVASEVAKTPSEVGKQAKSFRFPPIGPSTTNPSATAQLVGGGPASTAGDATGGDVAVLMRDDPEARKLLRFLATPEAAEPWMQAGGFLSPNRSANLDLYPDDGTRGVATGLVEARSLSFDLSDQLPVAFGGTPGQGMWRILQDFLSDPSDPQRVAQRLQDGYQAATKGPP